MNRLERYEDLNQALLTALDGRQREIWTGLPCIIQSFDPVRQICTAQPAVRALITLTTGETAWVQLPLLVDVPVEFPCGGGYTLTFPVVKGDECYVKFASRCIDAWWAAGGIQNQPELRMHDLSDGVAFVGIRSQVNLLTGGASTLSAQLRSDAGTTFLDLVEGHITIQATQIDLTSWAGMIAPFAMGSIPAGWLACPPAQTLVSTVTYARLFAAIGYTWGGSGASFGLPYFAAGYVPIQGTPGVLSHGALLAHTHGLPIVWSSQGGTNFQVGSNWLAQSINATDSFGGPDNLAAGMGVQLCVKY